jgi:hypothetical protein
MAHRAPHVLPRQKALVQMHMQFSQVLRDVTGITGQHILRASVAGERNPRPLAALRNSRCQKDANALPLALPGTWRQEPLVVLPHALALFDCSTAQLSECDAYMARAFAGIQPRFEPAPEEPVPAYAATPPRRKPPSHRQNAPAGNTRAQLIRITGVEDRVAVHGLSDAIAPTRLAEMGTDMRKWPEDKHLCSWLGLAPTNDLSGGQTLQSRPMHNRHRAAQAFRMAAQSVRRAACAFGAFYRRVKGRLGPAQALGATAHTLARTVYPLLKEREPSPDIGAAEYNKRWREREMKYLQKKAAQLGYTLSPP